MVCPVSRNSFRGPHRAEAFPAAVRQLLVHPEHRATHLLRLGTSPLLALLRGWLLKADISKASPALFAALREAHDRRKAPKPGREITILGRDEGVTCKPVLGNEPFGPAWAEHMHVDVSRGRDLGIGARPDGPKLVSTVGACAHPAIETGVESIVRRVVVTSGIRVIHEDGDRGGRGHPVWFIDGSRDHKTFTGLRRGGYRRLR